jgi:hypothetical protein
VPRNNPHCDATVSVVSAAKGDPITIPCYTVTDLGAGTPTFSTDASGNGVLNAPSGQTYAFPQTPNTSLTPGQGIMANFPLQDQSPTSSNLFDSSEVTRAIMNSNGVVAATLVSGYGGIQNGDISEGTESEFLVQRNPNGTWGQQTLAYQSAEPTSTGPTGFQVVGLSNTNQILIQNGNLSQGLSQALVYNLNTNTLIDLASLLRSANLTYYGFTSVAIDDAGRILLQAQVTLNGSDPNPFTNLLLTPDGLAAGPLEVAAPEPGTLGIMLMAVTGFAAHRFRERRRHSSGNKADV